MAFMNLGRHARYQTISEGLPTQADAESVSESHSRVAPQLDGQRPRSFMARLAMLSAMFLLASAALIALLSQTSTNHSNTAVETATASGSVPVFDDSGRYIMNNYDTAKPMANFLPGLGGIWGVPMWVFYVNRGQGITSFGVRNKDAPILKFVTAEKAYQQTAFNGFRTFLKGKRGDGPEWKLQAFAPTTEQSCGVPSNSPERTMKIGMNDMQITEINKDLGLKIDVLYYTVPNEDFASLVRKVTFENLDQDKPLSLELLDGLSKLEPFGISNMFLDSMGRTMEGWMRVYNVQKGDYTLPFFHVTMSTGDTAKVDVIKEGHFSVAYVEDDGTEGTYPLLPFIVDPVFVFGSDTTLTSPKAFFSDKLENMLTKNQGLSSQTPCAYAAADVIIAPGKNVTLTSVYGHANTLEQFVNEFLPKIRRKGFTSHKHMEALQIVDEIVDKITTNTSNPVFNMYVKMNFLDNALRGGLPLTLGDYDADPKIFHVFSRIHGDIERDYNYFSLDMTYFSQGPGNSRDVNQNRRLDTLIFPEVGDFNLRMFLSFVQLDGFNPLTVASTNFKISSDKIEHAISIVSPYFVTSTTNAEVVHNTLTTILSKSFRPGAFFSDAATAGLTVPASIEYRSKVLDVLITSARQEFAAQYAQNGFWTDHWTYTQDLLDSFLAVYPDREKKLLWESKPIPFYVSPSIVKPRKERYVLTEKGEVRSYNAVLQWGELGFPDERMDLMKDIFATPDYVVDKWGAGGVWHLDLDDSYCTVTVIAKLSMLAFLKFSALDPSAMGVEMEGGKPGWNDAMNGLPGLLGSGMPETYEMLRIIYYLQGALGRYSTMTVSFPKVFVAFIEQIVSALDIYEASAKTAHDDFLYWNNTSNAREEYRSTLLGAVDCSKVDFSAAHWMDVLARAQRITSVGIQKALATNGGLSPSYFYYSVPTYDLATVQVVGLDGLPHPQTRVTATSTQMHTLPNFLEGPVRHMKVLKTVEEKRDVYHRVKNSGLYDTELKMFKICESLTTLSPEVGRMVAFSPGWLENESIWLHMAYKFLLEMLRGKLYEEFFEEIKGGGLVPFMDPQVYGRSPIEAASFIVSSAFGVEYLHGQGYLARLSGSTAEFLSMWHLMFCGGGPFYTDDVTGDLVLELKPAIPGWLFTETGTVGFTLLGKTVVTYHNPSHVDTWKANACFGRLITDEGRDFTSTTSRFGAEPAKKTRSLQVRSIDITLCA